MPGKVRCGGDPVAAVQWRRPYQTLGWARTPPTPISYRFRIAADGRPLSIAKAIPTSYLFGVEDVAPSLAASRFAPGTERGDCTVTYTPRLTSFAETPVEDLVSYTLNPLSGPLPREGWAAIFPAAATCDDEPKPAPLNQAFPDYDKVPGTPGVRDWTLLGYDTDDDGVPKNIGVVTGTRNAALDAAGAAALARSRYAGGRRTGCRFPYVKTADILPAPAMPATATFQTAAPPAACKAGWATKPPLRYPAPYRRRAIEGWAVIGFDVAPWGATGNVRVLESEPAADFGEQAADLIRAARRAPSPSGATGCVERVRFQMGRPGMAPDTEMVAD
jgi:TonB family protein